ncbi:related to F-box domain protein [Rhynchosporium agropyri]|uniref:Related to F-box domain protein n=1 Tax=Rhynchosporium agropyri TaxID=914238 RepID=A0A1E1JZ41_9HELO|nr:related to F-box domain protein [Rhynchosporium agropyri]
MDITTLPNDIFRLVLDYLPPEVLILLRRVSRQFHATLTETDLCHHLLMQHFPRCREIRYKTSNHSRDWALELLRVTKRYHHLVRGTPNIIEKLPLAKSFVVPAWSRNYPVAPWQRLLNFEDKSSPFHYPDTLWTFDDGILIYPCAQAQSYSLYDLSTGAKSNIDLASDDKIIRRIRLKDRVLIVEWCEFEPYHQLNENEMVHRHFATAYGIKQIEGYHWNVVFRNEWKIHLLGLPLNSHDRFFSTHTSAHYAIYTWQNNRSAWGEDDPIESLTIWDIASPSPYRPSEDPTGKLKLPAEGPRVVRLFSFADLDFYQIRQSWAPTVRCLELDEGHIYVIQENHRWLVGQQASEYLPPLHHVKTTGIPFGTGPMWQDECGANGDTDISFCDKQSNVRSPNIAPCWRHAEFPYLTITEVVDSDAGVVLSAQHCFRLEVLSFEITPRYNMNEPQYTVSLRYDLWPQVLGKGKLCGDERFIVGENANQEVVILHFDELEFRGMEN